MIVHVPTGAELEQLRVRFEPRWELDPDTGCWLWPSKRYGRLAFRKTTTIYAHRVAWMLHRGPIPAGQEVMHDCPAGDNPRCVNPEHLRLGSHGDNMRDAFAKGLRKVVGPRGAAHPRAKLHTHLGDIRARLARGETQRSIARLYGVNPTAINHIAHGKSYREEG